MLNDLTQYMGRDILIAAIVTNAEHRFTKRGDGFGTLTVEDYQDAFRLNLFNENYLKFKHFMEPGTFITMKGRIEVPRHRQQLEFVVHSIDLLKDLREKRTKSLHLKFSSKEVDHLMIDKLNELFNQNQGNCQLHFTVYDPIEGYEVNLPSRSVKIQPSTLLFKELAKLDVTFRLN